MSFATITVGGALAIGGGLAAAGSVATGLLQKNSTDNAAKIQQDSTDKSLAFNEKVFDTNQANAAPWLKEGQTALGQLAGMTGPGGSLLQPYGKSFEAPTGVTEENDPGFQFRLQQGMKALQNSAAAKGQAQGGAALKEAERYGQDYASNEYSNVYNRALQGYNTNYNVWANDQGNTFNRLAALSGAGQTAVAGLNSAGQSAASNAAGINQSNASALGGLATSGAASLGAGIVGATNAVNSGIGNYNQYQLLQQILNQRQTSSGYV